jgi:hypothetical protein
MKSWMFAWVVMASSAPAAAQIVTPVPAAPGVPIRGELTASSPRLPDGGPFACYAIETSRGQRVAVTMRSDAIDSQLWIARGGACTGAAVQHVNDNHAPETLDARVTFTGAGGRYLIIARSTPAAIGPFELLIDGGDQIRLASADTPASEADRRRIMARETAARRAEIAAEEQRRRDAEAARARADAQRRAEAQRRRAESDAFWTGLLDFGLIALEQVTYEMEQENRRIEAETQRMIADRQAAERRAAEQGRREQAERQAAQQREQAAEGTSTDDPRASVEAQRRADEQRQIEEAEARRIAEQERQAEERRQQAEERRQRAEAERRERERIIAMPEGVVVCPTDGARLFGEMMCYGPFQPALSDIDEPYDISLACGTGVSSPTDFGVYNGRYRVWGCGYGINPTRSGSPNIDQAERYGLIIPPRRTYHCPANISGYCRN